MKMLSGKCKEEFDSYFWSRFNEHKGINTHEFLKELEGFRLLDQVIIEYFDSVRVDIDVRIEFCDSFVLTTFDSYVDNDYVGNFGLRKDAFEYAIFKANEIRNAQLTKKELLS